MIVAQFALADASNSQIAKEGVKKAPPKRTAQAVADRTMAPEPR